MVDLQLLEPSARCLFVSSSFSSSFFLARCDTGNVLCTHIRLNPSITQWQWWKKEEIRSFSFFFLLLLAFLKAILSNEKNSSFYSFNQPTRFSLLSFLLFFLVRCTCCMPTSTNQEKLSCHRLGREKESNLLTEETSDGGKSEFHLHSQLVLGPAARRSSYWYSNKHTTILCSSFVFFFSSIITAYSAVDFSFS